jgi:hypothetical protein
MVGSQLVVQYNVNKSVRTVSVASVIIHQLCQRAERPRVPVAPTCQTSKRAKPQNVPNVKRAKRQNVRNVKTSKTTKRAKRQNVPNVKTCQTTKRATCQNVPNVKTCQTSQRVKRAHVTNVSMCHFPHIPRPQVEGAPTSLCHARMPGDTTYQTFLITRRTTSQLQLLHAFLDAHISQSQTTGCPHITTRHVPVALTITSERPTCGVAQRANCPLVPGALVMVYMYS